MIEKIEIADDRKELSNLVHGYIREPEVVISKALKQIEDLNTRFLVSQNKDFGWTAYILSTFLLADIHFRAYIIVNASDDEPLSIVEDLNYFGSLADGYGSTDSKIAMATMGSTLIRFEEFANGLLENKHSWQEYLILVREEARQNYEAMHLIANESLEI